MSTDLEQQIREARRTITSDGYPMSVGELTNLYRDGELVIRPEFQRFFRWSDTQKSRLIESLLLAIPLPSIFVAQDEDGRWELVDGLQRVSTILELQGELRDPSGSKRPPLVLTKTKFLPALEGCQWDDPDPSHSLSEAQRLDVKRSKLDIKIIKRESSPQAKYDLFQRLNSYGSLLTAQELRSALLVAVSPSFLAWVERLASHASFVACTSLSERLLDERYDLELVLRFLVLHNRPVAKLTLSALRDFSEVLDDESKGLAVEHAEGSPELERVFKATFDVLAVDAGDQVFRRWDARDNVFRGSFLNTAFEVFGLGTGYHIANSSPYRRDITGVLREFWSNDRMTAGFATGRSTEARMAEFIPAGRTLMSAPADA